MWIKELMSLGANYVASWTCVGVEDNKFQDSRIGWPSNVRNVSADQL